MNWNTRDLLCSCLESLDRFPPTEPYETIVVDNDSTDGSAEAVEAKFPLVRLIKSGSNLGYAAGNNLAFGRATGDLILTLNPDTEFEDGSLQSAIDLMHKSPSTGVLAIRLVGHDGATQRSVRGFPTIAGLMGHWARLDRIFLNSFWASYSLPGFNYSEDGPAEQPMGTFLLFRTSALKTVGDPKRPFDETFPIFFNEVDLLKRLHDAGWPCWYLASAHVRHLHGASTRLVRKSMIWESQKSLVRYMGKHTAGASRLWLPLLRAASWASALVRARGVYAGFRPDDNNL